MSIQKLFQHFDAKTKLWIRVNEVKAQINELGCEDEIEFHFVDIEEAKVRGFLVRTGEKSLLPYADPLLSDLKSDIYIAQSLPERWRRVVAVKELLHIIDMEQFTAQSREAVNDLLKNMALPSEVREYRASYLNDRLRLISAISILVPRHCREVLRALYQSNQVTVTEIALMAKIPNRFVPFLMSEEFEETFNQVHELDNYERPSD